MIPRKLSLGLAGLTLFATLTLGMASALTLLRLEHAVQAQVDDIQALGISTLNLSSEVYARGGEKIGEFASEERYFAPLASLPPALIQAFLSAEDKDFYHHHGVSPLAIARAMLANLRHAAVRQGASTITQQLARLAFLDQSKTWERKAKEALLALAMEKRLDKATILELYLNKIYLGNRSYGVEAAARNYFRKHARDLTVGEAALLAGLPKNPTAYAPHRHPQAASRRQALVLRRMAEDGYLSAAAAARWTAEPLRIASGPQDYSQAAPYFTQAVAQELARKFELGSLPRRGLKIYTTLDARLQKAAATELARAIAAADHSAATSRLLATGKTARRSPTADHQPGLPAETQGALVSLDPRTGEVLAMQGGRDFAQSQFNRSAATKRPLGAVFLPIYIALALENGYTLASRVSDDPFASRHAAGPAPMPLPAPPRDAGSTLYEALLAGSAYAAAPLYTALGDGSVRAFAKGFGLNFERSDLSLAFGTGEATPTQIAAAYAAFVNGGLRISPTLITKVTTTSGDVLYEAAASVRDEQRALSPQAAYIVGAALYDALAARQPAAATRLATSCGMAGVSEDLHDAWFIGAAPTLVSAVWLGAEHGKARLASSEQAALQTTTQAWRAFMAAAPARYRNTPPLAAPSGISFVRQAATAAGKLPAKLPFLAGSEPKTTTLRQ